jgi:DNA-nicking Smr family endonuclease
MAGGRKRRRGLTEDEQELWQKAVKSAEPLAKRAPSERVPEMMVTPAASRPTPKSGSEGITPFQVGELAATARARSVLAPRIDEIIPHAVPNMDRRNFDRLRKGRMKVEAKLDLHGMTLTEAHPALSGFVRKAHQDGKRLLLVITGKGKTGTDDGVMPRQRGLLRHQVPQWLNQSPLSPLILQVVPAQQRDGGQGALYVYLRRSR